MSLTNHPDIAFVVFFRGFRTADRPLHHLQGIPVRHLVPVEERERLVRVQHC